MISQKLNKIHQYNLLLLETQQVLHLLLLMLGDKIMEPTLTISFFFRKYFSLTHLEIPLLLYACLCLNYNYISLN